MKKLFLVLGLLASNIVLAECPSTDSDEIVAHISAASGQCREAVKRAEECAWGSGIDAQFTQAAREICEPKFLPKLSNLGKQGYEKAKKFCWDKVEKYKEPSGFLPTLYSSQANYCTLYVSRDYAAFF